MKNIVHLETTTTTFDGQPNRIVDPIYSFLKWVASNPKTFGRNLPEVYQQFLTDETG